MTRSERPFTYKLHPTTVVLRSQQLNLLESQQQIMDESYQGLRDDEANNIFRKDTNSLIPQYTIPAQLFTPKSESAIANRSSLIHSHNNPTLLPHSHQQQQQSNLAQEIEQHIQQQNQQQQSAFTGPFLLYRNPDLRNLKSLKTMFFTAVAMDLVLLIYLYLGTTFIPALSNFKISMPIFGLIIENTEQVGLMRKIFDPIALVMAVVLNACGVLGLLKNKLRFVSYFIALGITWIIISTIVISISSFFGASALIGILRLAWFALILWIAIKARTKMQVNWYMTNQF